MPGLAEQAEHELATVAVWEYAHGIVNNHARVEFNVMIHDTERVHLGEADSYPPERSIRNPDLPFSLNLRASQALGP